MSFHQFLLGKISLILKQCIVTKADMTIQFISQDVLNLINFSIDELYGKNIVYLTKESDAFDGIAFDGDGIFVQKKHIHLHDKWNRAIRFFMEVFDTKHVVPSSNLYVVRLIPTTLASDQIDVTTEIDQFIYNMSHDIRGPVATIQGLVSLLKMKGPFLENDALITMIEQQALILDKRLFDLAYLAKAGAAAAHPTDVIHISKVEERLKNFIPGDQDPASFFFSSDCPHIHGIDESILFELLDNMLLFISQLPAKEGTRKTSLHLEIKSDHIAVFVEATCVQVESDILSRIFKEGFVFSEVVDQPQLLQFYAAKRIVERLGGDLVPAYRFPNTVLIVCSVPTRA